MRSKASLTLMEQTVMILVFALAAVLCLRAFVWSDGRSRENAARDHAVLCGQNAAETLKSCRGDYAAAAKNFGGSWDGTTWVIRYDQHWRESTGAEAYRLEVLPGEKRLAYLGEASVQVYDASGGLLTQLDVCWQEVGSNAG